MPYHQDFWWVFAKAKRLNLCKHDFMFGFFWQERVRTTWDGTVEIVRKALTKEKYDKIQTSSFWE
jgi:hypothetical protein